MSRKLIQTKLSFSSSQPDLQSDKEAKPVLKRERSDSAVDEKMADLKKPRPNDNKTPHSYADAVQARSRDTQAAHHMHMHEGWRSGKDKPIGSSVTRYPYSPATTSHNHKEHSFPEHSSDKEENSGAATNSRSSDLETEPVQDSSASSDDEQAKKNTEKPRSSHEHTNIWKGVPITKLERAPECFGKISLPPLKPSKSHKVFFKVPIIWSENESLKPYSESHRDVWDDYHVYMPNSKRNEMTHNGAITSRWEKIVKAMTRTITDSFNLEHAILSYNLHYKNRWNFDALHKYFQDYDLDSKKFFDKILPKMQELALKLPELFPKAIPILKQGKNMKLTFSQEQVACLLANAFFCTFPKRNFKNKFGRLTDINFSNLYCEQHGPNISRKFEKLSCIINYFQRVTESMPNGCITYARQYTKQLPDFWKNMSKKFTNLHVSTTGTIEDDGRGMLQADFANKYVGGGVLGHGLVQEEIRFVICPEMIVSRLFTEVLTDDEVLIMTGCERFNRYEGYSETFKFTGDYHDQTERDEYGRRCTEVVAMDALIFPRSRKSDFEKYMSQFEKEKVFRELNKAYCAFLALEIPEQHLPAVCTGNWGCGAFGGDKELKAIIQMMAASAVGRDICYFTFGDHDLCNRMGRIYNILKNDGITIANTLGFIKAYHEELKRSGFSETLFEYIAKTLGEKFEISSTDKKKHRQNSNVSTDEESNYHNFNNDSSNNSMEMSNEENYRNPDTP